MSHKQPSLIAINAVILVCLWSSPAWCQYHPTLGPYKVLTLENIVLHDAVRNKNIPIKIYYPAAGGRCPVIIFSHGGLASKDSYAGLGQYWASYGYVSIHPSHADSVADSGFRPARSRRRRCGGCCHPGTRTTGNRCGVGRPSSPTRRNDAPWRGLSQVRPLTTG